MVESDFGFTIEEATDDAFESLRDESGGVALNPVDVRAFGLGLPMLCLHFDQRWRSGAEQAEFLTERPG